MQAAPIDDGKPDPGSEKASAHVDFAGTGLGVFTYRAFSNVLASFSTGYLWPQPQRLITMCHFCYIAQSFCENRTFSGGLITNCMLAR